MSKIKLLTNIPLDGMIERATFAPSSQGYDDEVSLTLIVPSDSAYGKGKHSVYLKLWAAQRLAELGALTVDNTGEKPVFTVLGRPIVRILKTEEGTTKRIAIDLLPGGLPATPAPAPAPYSMPTTQERPGTVENFRGKPEPTPPTDEELKAQAANVARTNARDWYLLGEMAEVATFLAARALSRATARTVDELEPMAVHALASTLIISADKRGVMALPGVAQKVRAAFSAAAPVAPIGYAGKDEWKPEAAPEPEPGPDDLPI